MSSDSILMAYKENCKIEGVVITRLKIARIYFSGSEKQNEIALRLKCHPNTVNGIIRKCRKQADKEAWKYLKSNQKILSSKLSLFDFFKDSSRKPKSNKRSLASVQEELILEKQADLNYGYKRLYNHLNRQGFDTENIYTLGKIKGVYRRNNLKAKKIRTANKERRSLYNYDKIEAFEYLQYDVKEITDQHSLPAEIYHKFKYSSQLPRYQWTIIDVKTKTRFLAWSHSSISYFGLKFLELVLVWLRAHNIIPKINIQVDGGREFYSGSKRKQKEWNKELSKYNAYAYDTEGIKWKQNIVERSHKTDDEEFYCPRGEHINSKGDFIFEGQYWIFYYNHRSNQSATLNGLSPQEKLIQLGIVNAESIVNFPCIILEDFFQPLQTLFPHYSNWEKSQYVFDYYLLSPHIY